MIQKIIKSNNTFLKRNCSTCEVIEYAFNQPNFGIARAKINGRYPTEQNRKIINKESDIIYFVIGGSGVIHTQDGNSEIEINDALYLPHKEWYWIEGNNLDVLVISAPDWTPEQYVIV
jgi:mannose-6-phosphate isomerase-like protein (cupin superfamily)